MSDESLSAALEREHREIDAGIEAFLRSADPACLRSALAALRRHIYLEEEFLFPPLRDGGLMGPIFVMLREHGELWDVLVEIEARLAAGKPVADSACRDLLDRLAAHNSKEEPIVYPEIDRMAQAMGKLLDSAVMPDGWACAKASTA